MRGTWRREMFTSGIALRRHLGLTVTSQPFSVSWTPFSCENVVDRAHCCPKSLSAWNAALTTGLGFSSLTPDTISTDLEALICNWCWDFHINTPEVTTRAGLWWDRPGHPQLVAPAAGGDKNHAAPSIPVRAMTHQHPNPPSCMETSHPLLCSTED